MIAGALVAGMACGPSAGGGKAKTPDAAGAAPATATVTPVVLCLGTSLTAGFGLEDPELAWPALVQRKVDEAGLSYRVVNAGLSGETSAGALRRLDWLMQQKIGVLVLETGANDALRGQAPEATRANIDAILARVRAQAPPSRLVLLGMKAPPNLGREYARRFESIYPDLAAKHQAVLVPFVLEGVAGIAALNQPDGVHPTPEGQRLMAETVWGTLKGVLSPPAVTRR